MEIRRETIDDVRAVAWLACLLGHITPFWKWKKRWKNF